MIKEGDLAPDFELAGDDGEIHRLKEHQGRPIVLYFYPKDMTPGCTTEACEFNDSLESIQAIDAIVYGISRDNLASHARFKSKYALQFTLLSDPDSSLHKKYGAFNERPVRTTVLIGKDGKIAKVWPKVRVKGHVRAVVDYLAKVAQTTPVQPEELLFRSVRTRL